MLGLFDSGSGGLTVLAAIRKRTPNADVVYFGDIKNAPYGLRTPEELAALTEAGIAFLTEKGAREIVSACNSVSTAVLEGAAGNARVIEMTRPFARAMRKHAGKRFLLLATPATIEAGIYADALGVTIQLEERGIPDLAGAIEFAAPEEEVAGIVREALEEKRGKEFDGIILGCTHYPLARAIIEEVAAEFFDPLLIIDPAEAVAEEVSRQFHTKGNGSLEWYISEESKPFRDRVKELFPHVESSVEVV
jgi:glutamate racemase